MSNDKRCCPTDAPPASSHYDAEGDDMYMSGPMGAKAGVVLVSDIFGMLPNSKRFADELGKAGFLVVMPDFFREKVWLQCNYPPNYEDPKWIAFRDLALNTELHRVRSLRAIALLKKLGCEKVGIVGMCWGAIVATDLSSINAVDAAGAAHPGFMTPERVSAVRTPFCMLTSIEESDYEPVEKAFQALNVKEKIFKHYDTLHHGFLACRFDPAQASDVELRDREEAKNIMINFFKSTMAS